MKNEERKKREEILRQRAESILNNNVTRKSSQLSEVDILKLIHELEVHQVELKLQNEELQQAKEAEKVAAEQKYLQLYDFAPTGYYTLSNQGDIMELNLMGAKLLGKERSYLKNSRFAYFVSDDSKSIFNQFLETVILSNSQESCEITLSSPDELTIHLTGVASKKGKQCLVTAIDITEPKRAEIALRESDIQLKKYSEDLEKLNKDGTTAILVDRF